MMNSRFKKIAFNLNPIQYPYIFNKPIVEIPIGLSIFSNIYTLQSSTNTS